MSEYYRIGRGGNGSSVAYYYYATKDVVSLQEQDNAGLGALAEGAPIYASERRPPAGAEAGQLLPPAMRPTLELRAAARAEQERRADEIRAGWIN